MEDTQSNQQAGLERGVGLAALFTSLSTLFCCALPILFVTLGFGASWAALYASIPAIGFIAQNKFWFFIFSGALLAIALFMLFRPGQSCPSDPKLAALCATTRRWNKRLIYVSMMVWLTGFVAAYLSVPLLNLFQ